jgi:hypothetical protein
MQLSVRDELRSHTPHAIPLILVAHCWLMLVCVETLEAPFELAAVCGPISPCCRYTRRLSLYSSLMFTG